MSATKVSADAERANVSPDKIMKMALGFWQSKVLMSATELGVFTELGKQPLTAEELTKRLSLNERSSRDFFDSLVALGLLERHDDVYSNSPETADYLDAAKPTYIGGFLIMSSARLYHSWANLTDALRTGKPQSESKDKEDLFGELYADQERLKGFLSAMTGISRPLARSIAEKFDWSKHKTFIDVGAAQGALPVEVAARHEHLTGHGFDLPQVEPVFNEYVARHGLESRVSFASGDFFKDELPKCDVIVMGHILHDWDLEQKQMLINKAYRALNPGGTLIVYDAMIDPERKTNAFGLLMSLNMLIETPGGFDYGWDECMAWFDDAGFTDLEVIELSPTHSMCIGTKP